MSHVLPAIRSTQHEAPVISRGQVVLYTGMLAGILCAAFGMAHLLNRRVIPGLIYILLGWLVWLPIVALTLYITAGLGVFLILPLHVLLASLGARAGARLLV